MTLLHEALNAIEYVYCGSPEGGDAGVGAAGARAGQGKVAPNQTTMHACPVAAARSKRRSDAA